eukprot:scaffold36079_cov112-Isochrysis_galbana.AAC.1
MSAPHQRAGHEVAGGRRSASTVEQLGPWFGCGALERMVRGRCPRDGLLWRAAADAGHAPASPSGTAGPTPAPYGMCTRTGERHAEGEAPRALSQRRSLHLAPAGMAGSFFESAALNVDGALALWGVEFTIPTSSAMSRSPANSIRSSTVVAGPAEAMANAAGAASCEGAREERERARAAEEGILAGGKVPADRKNAALVIILFISPLVV